MTNLENTRYLSLILKVTGIIFIASAIVDFITLSIPIKLSDSVWQVEFVNNVVDRGIVPLLGMLLILFGYWLDTVVVELHQTPSKKKKKSFNWKLFVYSLGAIVGVCYLLLIPIHIININEIRRLSLAQINLYAQQSETQIKSQQEQIQELIDDPQAAEKLQKSLAAINEISTSGRRLSPVQQEKLVQEKQRLITLQGYLDEPDGLEKEINKLQTQLDSEKLKRVTQATLESFKQTVRISFNALCLAITYSLLGWLGLKNTLKGKPKTRTSVQ